MNKRYNSINEYLKTQFNERVFKVSLDRGSSCPNRDGSVGSRGCSYCNMDSLIPITSVSVPGKVAEGDSTNKSIGEQLQEGIDYIRKRHKANKVIAYFQNGSNTYASAEDLSRVFREVLSHPSVVGLAISTRPDCLEEEHLSLLKGLSQETFLWVELGLQSSHDRTLERICRGHTVEQFRRANQMLLMEGIRTCAHIILGLPGESLEMMKDTIRFLNESGIWGIKIHNLHVLQGTPLEDEYYRGEVELPSLSLYASWVCDCLECLAPSTIIHRFSGHSPRALTVAPDWSINKLAVFNEVELELLRRNSWQGKRFES